MEVLQAYKMQLIETIVIVLIFLSLRVIINKAVSKTAEKFNYQTSRIVMFKKIFSGLAILLLILILTIVWGVDQSRLFLYISSLLTVLAVAFVAQWSVLSNITATVIIFFYHPVKIDDQISIHEKDSLVQGRIVNIGLFFITIVTDDKEQITIPSNLFIQKAIKRQHDD